jgi:hypothetical protein
MQGKRDGPGAAFGMLTFFAGIGLLALTFWLAYRMFMTPPDRALGIEGAGSVDFGLAGQSLATILIRVLLLVVMGIVGSLIANRGVSLYQASLQVPAETRSSHPEERSQESSDQAG